MSTDLEAARQQFLAGVAHFEAGRLAPARQAFEQALQHAPGRPSVLRNLGITCWRLGEWSAAVPPLQQAVAAEPGDAETWAALGRCQQELGRWADAAAALQQAAQAAQAAQQTPEPDPRCAGWWLASAQARAQAGDLPAALPALDAALALNPSDATAWSVRGSVLRELQRLPEAATSFERAMAFGADAELHRYYLAAVRGQAAPEAAPRAYMEALFDSYAGDFQHHLLHGLRYQAHETLVQPLLQAGRRWGAVLDLGCGTGLCGLLLRGQAQAVDGVDLSASMVAAAQGCGAYRQVTHADLGTHLATLLAQDAHYELILAADVFIYVGALDAVFAPLRQLLAPLGCFAFSVEEGADTAASAGLTLQPSLRYAHSEAYVRNCAARHGFAVHRLHRAPLRQDQQRPVPGLYVELVVPTLGAASPAR